MVKTMGHSNESIRGKDYTGKKKNKGREVQSPLVKEGKLKTRGAPEREAANGQNCGRPTRSSEGSETIRRLLKSKLNGSLSSSLL